MVVCSTCGQENPADARFCNACATPLDAPAAEIREERKTISVVFVDLVGFTARSEQLDPEDVRGVLAPYHARVREELERHGGAVEKFIGDAVMAVFGAPAAHEDDAERAVRAALAIRDWAAASELDIRVGVNTGEALVTVGARAEAGESFVAGDVVNTAARLQTAAPVGGILVGERTAAATRDAIRYGAPSEVDAKGKTAPVPAWTALEPIASVGVDLSPTRTPLVGREREVELLVSFLRGIVDDRGAQLITIVGVPGIGKSRLVSELYRLVDAAPELIVWRQGRCLSYGDGIAYWALGEIVKAEAGMLETDGTDDASAKLTAAVERLTGDGAEARWLDQALRPLVGLAEGGSTEAATGAWRRFLEAMTDRGPAVLVFEDVHWADDGLLEFLEDLVDWLRTAPLLVVATARPELLERRPGWGGGKANATTMSLQPLRDEETASLVASLLERPVQDAAEQQILLERAGGNPLFAEQYVRMLAERGSTGELPDSVQGVIAARVDALPAPEKTLLQEAAVYGKVFWTGAVTAALGVADADDLLRRLERQDFLRRERRSAVAGDTQYAFHHVLLRDVAYGQIPRRLRAEKHRRAAEWTAGLGRPDELAELIAYHYKEALEVARSTGAADDEDLVARARRALRAAGDRALALGAYRSAGDAFRDALALAGDDEEGAELELLHARTSLHVGEDARAGAARAVERFLRIRDDLGAARAEALAAVVAWTGGDRAATDRHLGAALEYAGTEPTDVRADVLARQAGLSMLAGRFDEAIRVGSQAIALAESLGSAREHRSVWSAVATARCCLGDTGGLDALAELTEVALAEGSFEVAALAVGNLSSELHIYGRLAEARQAFDRDFELSTAYGLGRHLRLWRSERAEWAYADGAWDDALATVDELIAAADASVPTYSTAGDLALRAWIRLVRGDREGGGADARRTVDLARASDAQAQATAYPVAAALALATGNRTDADELANDILELGTVLVPALCAPFPTMTHVAWVFRDLDRASDLREQVLDATPIESPWNDAARAILNDDLVAAADTIEGIGSHAAAAYTRYRAGGPEWTKATEFMERAGITGFPVPGGRLGAESAA
ncbi:MAG TPA: adenylate/guanylate cyclase domain-containing protein [Gaiellaceae bacterium]|nr:adenylate/guanylate cyclase domain-containing protein [Gaiellaceae bacterium]